MASRRAAVTCVSRSSMAFSRAGDSGLSPDSVSSGAADFPLSGLALSASPWAAFSATGLAAHAPAERASESESASAVAPRRQLFVVLVLIRPVLAFERPVLLVVAHQPLEL